MIGNLTRTKGLPASPCCRRRVPSTSDQDVGAPGSALPFQERGVHTHARTQAPVAPRFPQSAGTPCKGHNLPPLVTAVRRLAEATRASPACGLPSPFRLRSLLAEARTPPYRAPCDVRLRLLRCFPASNFSSCHPGAEPVLRMCELVHSVGS